MPKEILAALIGAAATIVASAVGAYLSISVKERNRKESEERRRLLEEGKPLPEEPARPRQFYKKEWAMMGVAVIVAAVIIVLGVRAARTDGAADSPAGDYANFVERAREAKVEYVVEAATMVIEVDAGRGPDANELRVSRHITYTLRALEDIPYTSHGFYERYDTELAKEVIHWTGTGDEQALSSGGSEYYVALEMKKGELRTFSTGVDTTYALPLADDRPAFYGQVHLDGRQDYANYDNDDAYICDLNIIVRSRTTPIRPAGDSAGVTLIKSQKIEFSGVKHTTPKPGTNGWHTLSKSWSFVTPGQAVGILFQW